MIETFHFLRPAWLLAIIPLLGLAWLWIRRTQRGSGWESAIDPLLLDVLLETNHNKAGKWVGYLLMTALVSASLGLAGPTWEKLPQNVEQKQDTLIILLDLSLSMLAEDIKPSRVERARQKIADILRTRSEGQTALIAYAGDAHVVVPLTDDIGTIENLLDSLSPEMMPVFGSNPDHALDLAEELFDNSRTLQGRIIMVTDGIDSISSVSRHSNPSFPISILGLGTYEGGPVPLDRLRQPGRFLQTQEGNQVIALLDEERLSDVADLTHGRYAKAQVGDGDLDYVLASSLPGEDETIEVEREFDSWYDQGHWVVLVLIPLLLVSFRRGVLVQVAVTAIPTLFFSAAMLAGIAWSTEVRAAEAPQDRGITTETEPLLNEFFAGVSDTWQSLWMRRDQRAHRYLRHGEPEKAAALFESGDWLAVAQYRSADYATALRGFTDDPSATGHYNKGNALARLGEYEPAIEAYTRTLNTQPAHEDAIFNKALVERLLEEQQQAEQEQNQDQESQANNDETESQQDQQQQPQDDSEQQDQGDKSQEQENDQQQSEEEQEQQGSEQQMAEAEEDEAARDEKQEALEQWLRRVPDDPGGLIRRKFSHETKQRLRRGEYENRQQEKIW